MDAADKRMLEREALRNMIQQWNANRLDLFELSEPNENLEFHGVMRFYFQDSGQKIATKCIRVASDATVSDVIETLIEKFRPDMRMLSVGQYSLWETHGPRDERRLAPHEKPLLVQLNWHADDREGRFLLKCGADPALSSANEAGDQNFKRKLSKREKKELKKKEKLSRLKSDVNNENKTAEKLYTEMPETVFTRSISNPEAVMRRRRQQKLERKLQQFRATDGGPDTGGTLKIYGSSLCPDVPYKTLLVSVWDAAGGVLREMLDKYGLANGDPADYCLVQVDSTDNSEYVLEDDECPLAIVMTHPRRSSIMFHVRRRPADAQPRRRKKKVGGGGGGGTPRPGTEPALLEVTPEGAPLENGRRVRVTDVIEVGSGNGTALQLYGPSIQPRHCVIAPDGGGSAYTITPLHPDAACYVNGQRVTHTQRLQHGCLLKFGRVSTYRFVDPTQETILNRNLSQSQHFGSGSIYDRSPREAGTMSPDHLDVTNANTTDTDQFQRTMSPLSHDTYGYNTNETMSPYNNNNTLKLDNESIMMSQHMNDSKDDYMRDDNTGSVYNEQEQSGPRPAAGTNYKDNYETTFDIDGNVETKSICSAKSTGSGHDNRMSATVPASRPGQEAILPAVLEFGEAGQAQFLSAVITRLDPHAPAFKLAPVYTLYLCARYRASTHYRPELTPKERAHKLTVFLHHVATLIHSTVQERCTDSAAQAFWMANASELLHFLKCDRHISSFSTQAQDLLPTTVQNAFSNLVSCFQEELRGALIALCVGVGDATEATAPTLQALAAAMVLLRRCRVNAALTIQLFSHLFHYINATAFNKLVTSSGAGGAEAAWGAALSARLALLAAWAERQGLELAADCHLARTHQAARLIQGEYRTPEEVRSALASCFKLNSVQVRALLTGRSSAAAVEAGVAHARALADELYRADGREITLEESEWLGVGLLIPGDGFSAEVVRGVPPGLAEFIAPLQRGGLCRLAHQPHAIGVWTVYMTGYGNTATRRPVEPRVHIIQLNKNSNGMGLSIVAAKGAGQSKLGIYIKSVVAGGAAAADGRLAAGDQLLSVDGHSLVGITQEKAAEYLVRTGPTVTLEVGKQGAVLHGLATLLHQPPYSSSPAAGNTPAVEELEYEDRARRNSGTFTNLHPALLRRIPPRTELATAGYNRRYCNGRCHLRDESSESSSEDSEEYTPAPRQARYLGSIPRLIITLDQENNQLSEDQSPDTPGCPLELDTPQPSRPIPVFTFTCEDYDELQQCSSHAAAPSPPSPPATPAPPAPCSPQSSEMPPQMRPIDTRLHLELWRQGGGGGEGEAVWSRRCTGEHECVSACECCRVPHPDAPSIPYIDEADCEPLIYEAEALRSRVSTPKIRRILPALSLDKPDDARPETADAVCQTPSSPLQPKTSPFTNKKIDLSLDVKRDAKKFDNMHCRLKRALFSVSKSFSKSEETPSTYSTSDSVEEPAFGKYSRVKLKSYATSDTGAKQILDSVDRKSWKSPDEFRPSFGKVKALTKQFNAINLQYCAKNYKRNCQSSPNLSVREDNLTFKEKLHNSTSLADIKYESLRTETSDTKGEKMTDDEVKSIIIQLEDWSRFGSRGSGDTLAQGNEFELPNLPSEEHTDNNTGLLFNEILDKKPKKITLDNIILKTIANSPSKDSLFVSESLNSKENKVPRVVEMFPHASLEALRTSCPELSGTDAATSTTPRGGRRASERDLPGRLAAEAVKASRSTPALHHAPGPGPAPHPAALHHPPPRTAQQAESAAWAGKSRSSHNLSAPHDAFYQNLPALNDRWSSLRSSAGSRPQSAHFSPEHDAQAQQNNAAMAARNAKFAEMSEEVTRRQQHQQQMLQQQQQQQMQQQQMNYPMSPTKSPAMPHHGANIMSPLQIANPHMQMTSPNQVQPPMSATSPQMYQNHMQPQPQRYEWGAGPPSPLRAQPPVAPKPPNMRRPESEMEEQHLMSPSQPLSPHQINMSMNNVSNDDEWLVGSNGPGGAGHTNPWQREAREREDEQRRAVAAQRRSATIAQLVSLGSARTPQQNYQLRALQLEADFLRRAEQHTQEEGTEPHSPESPDREPERIPDRMPERIPDRMQERIPDRMQERERIPDRMQERIPDRMQERAPERIPDRMQDRIPERVSERIPERVQQERPQEQERAPPKSILKSHKTDNMANGHSDNVSGMVSTVSASLSSLTVGGAGPVGGVAAPPPPERGSSFAVMAALGDHHTSPPLATLGRDKRVSFHGAPPPPPATSPPPDAPPPAPDAPPAPHTPHTPPPAPDTPQPAAHTPEDNTREDPDRFLEEASRLVVSGAAHTPGVIGAQEVYRDPRARRLAAQSAAAAAAAGADDTLPEQMSFRDKMKMFALEAGDRHTPKDKVKISRAQRDIDAVH